MASSVKKPRVVAFEVTRRCKMSCVHCRASAQSDFQNDLATDQCKKIIKSVADYNRCVLIFTGGEPFERDDIFDLIDFAIFSGLAVSVATCGYNFDRTKAERLKKAGVLTLSFSLDSDNPEEHDNFRRTAGAFEKTLEAVNIAKNAGLKFQINTTVTKLNAGKLPAISKLTENLGAYCFNPFMLVPAGRAEGLSDIALTSREYEKVLGTVARLKAKSKIDVRFTCAPRFAVVYKDLYPQSKKKAFGCLAAADFAFISHAGDVQTCGFLKTSAGNLLKSDNLGNIWEKSDFLNSIRRGKFSGKCGYCNYIEICGGCRARAFARNNDCLTSDPLCSYVNLPTGLATVALPRVEALAKADSVSTLIAAHIEDDKLSAAADAVNSLPNVSHNYLRNHYFNLWFTLKAADFDRIEKIVEGLSKEFKTDFFSFPATKHYKLDKSAVKRHRPPNVFNALFCCRADETVLQPVVKFLCDLPQVSHCIQRKPLPHWPYNIYIMLHEKSPQQLEKIIDNFVNRFDIKQFQTMPTVKSLKKS
jgi:AdoMet-dependent heme synthase